MEITGILTALVVGAIIGGLGRLVVPGRQRVALWLTIAIGALAAIAGTAVAGVVGLDDTWGIDWIELFLQVGFAGAGIGAVAGRRRRAELPRS